MSNTSTRIQIQTEENIGRLQRKIIAIENQIKDWILSVHLLLLYPQENFWTADVTRYIQTTSRRITRLTIQLEWTQKELKDLCGIRNTEGHDQE